MKCLIVLAAIAIGCAHLPPPAPPAIGYVDLQRVADESAFGRQVAADIQAAHAREAATVAEAEKKHDHDGATMRAQLGKNDQARYAAGVTKIRSRVEEACGEVRRIRRLGEIRTKGSDSLSIENDLTDEVIKRMDAETPKGTP